MLKSRSVSIKESLNSAKNDGDGKENWQSSSVGYPSAGIGTLSPSLELVRLKLHQMLHEAGERRDICTLPYSALACICRRRRKTEPFLPV